MYSTRTINAIERGFRGRSFSPLLTSHVEIKERGTVDVQNECKTARRVEGALAQELGHPPPGSTVNELPETGKLISLNLICFTRNRNYLDEITHNI